jgi:hypothetical protein
MGSENRKKSFRGRLRRCNSAEGDASVPTFSTPHPPLRGGGFAGLEGRGPKSLIQVVDQVVDCFKTNR